MSCCGGHLGFAIHTHNANFVKEDPAIIQFQNFNLGRNCTWVVHIIKYDYCFIWKPKMAIMAARPIML
jgi:hypothetical protein